MDVIAGIGFGIQLDTHSEANNEFVTSAKPFFTFSFVGKIAIIGCKFK